MDPFISLIVPAYNEEAYLGPCLEYAVKEAARSGVSTEILVVNNASTDSTGDIAHGFAGVRVIDEPPKGLTKARQCGFEAAKGEIIAFVDADTRMPPGWIAEVARRFKKDRKLVCVSGPYTFYDLSVFGNILTSLYWSLLVWPTYLFTGFMTVGGNFAAKKSAIADIGGFDTSIAFYGEDANIGRRLHQVGRVTFLLGLPMPTSARRLKEEGVWRMAFRYSQNFLSEAFLKKPATASYKDIR